jgi:hypothetical protein
MLGHRQQHFFHGEFQFFCRALNDADIGLVRHQPIKVAVMQSGFGQHCTGRVFQHTHRKLEHALAVHFQHRIAQNFTPLHMSGHAQ